MSYFDHRYKPDYRNRIIVASFFAVFCGWAFCLMYRSFVSSSLIMPRTVGILESVGVAGLAGGAGFLFGYGIGVTADSLHALFHWLAGRKKRKGGG